MTIDNEAYSRHMAECERQARAEDAVTDSKIGEYIDAELLDEMADETASRMWTNTKLAEFCEEYAPKTYEKARATLIEKQAQAIEDQRRYGND